MKKWLTLHTLVIGALVLACTSTRKAGTEQIQNTASFLPGFDLTLLDSTYDPCQDFYMFTTARWMQRNPIPESESRWGSFNILIEENNQRLHTLLQEYASEDREFIKYSAKQLCTDFFKAAMDSASVETRALDELAPLLSLTHQIRNTKSLVDWFVYALQTGIRIPFYMAVRTDAKNPERYIVYWGQSGLSLPDRDNYLRTDSISIYLQEQYKAFLSDFFKFHGIPEQQAHAIADDVYGIELSLARMHMPRQDMRRPELTYNKYSVEEANQLTTHLKPGIILQHYGITTDSIVITHVQYLKSLDSVLLKFKPEQWRSYAIWKTYEAFMDAMPYALTKRHFDFFSGELYGIKAMKPRWKRVLSKMNDGLSEPLGRLFVERHFSAESKADVELMVENIREVFRERINTRDWMTPETRQKALEKLNAFTYKIGYPNKWKSYEGLEIHPSSYVRNLQNIRMYQFRDNFNRLGKPVDKSEWFMGAHIVNAYYNPSFNEIVFPAGILQPPFYNPEADPAINYGAIGGVIGHEFSHGFDDQGRKYNAFGQLSNWWNALDSAQFEAKTRLLTEHYNMYEPIPGYPVNGKMTLGENIADLGGLTLAYYAYKRYQADKPVQVISGFTPEMRLFLGWAQVWQSNVTDGYLRVQLTTDYHSPARYRVNGPMSMMQEFKQAWGCKEGDPMVKDAENRVVIW
ncbi:MAG: M13 family metallopeptidase [Thermaurantimonas sp.]